MLYPTDLWYEDAKVEVGPATLIVHSAARLPEFFYENNSPRAVRSLAA